MIRKKGYNYYEAFQKWSAILVKRLKCCGV